MNERLSQSLEESYWTNVPLMASVAKYVKSVVDFFINRKSIDPALVPLFTKFYPMRFKPRLLLTALTHR